MKDLLTDFSAAIADDKPIYFLGTIVLTKGEAEDVPEITDGQQRLATTTILLAAIRDWCAENGEPKRAHTITQTYLGSNDFATTELVPNLRLNVDDNEFFRRAILASPDNAERGTPPSKESHKRILAAARTCRNHLDDMLRTYSRDSQTDRLVQWERFIRLRARVILLRVPEDQDAYVMFETLNDRGLKASQADLIKNHLFRRAGNRLGEAQAKWSSMIGTLESIGIEDVTVRFLHHVVILREGPTKEREVLDKVKAIASGQNSAIAFLSELSETANDYAALYNADHSKWNLYGTSTRKHIETINRYLRVEQIRPLMLAIARYFTAREASRAFRMCVTWSVRFLIVGGRGGLLDRNYAVRAQEIGTKKVRDAKGLREAMGAAIPNDLTFEQEFARARVSQVQLARYYLRALERQLAGKAEPELIPEDDEMVVNLEHVLPETPQDNWPAFDMEAARAYWRRMGNMVIMDAQKNSAIGNKSFADKAATLRGSAFKLTAEVGEHERWGPEEIDARQLRLAGLAVSTWPIGP